MLKVKEKEPYIILPKQRYNLSTYEPHSVMNGDFTFFVEYKLDSEKMGDEYAIVARPGMHMGLMVKTIDDVNFILSWDFWTHVDGENQWNSVEFDMSGENGHLPNDKFFILIHHDVISRKFTFYLSCDKLKTPLVQEKIYEGKLVDYSETPYNIGCGNYSKVVPKRDRLFTACTIYKLGLIGTNDYTYEQIIKFLDATRDDVDTLSKSLFDIVFYFNFNLTNIYKVWDLSGHCNFMQKNLYIEDEETYLTDNDFYEDYANK
jgi:hypothetical protein